MFLPFFCGGRGRGVGGRRGCVLLRRFVGNQSGNNVEEIVGKQTYVEEIN